MTHQNDNMPHRAQLSGVLLAALCLSFGACSWVPKGEAGLDVGVKDRGIASWYGEQFHGKQAANGELFDMQALTAAHRTLPLGSMVRVVNLTNGKHVRVRINDRGPYVNGRILDLSQAAAVKLGMVQNGLSVIQLEVVGDRRPDFVLAEEEAPSAQSALLSVHHLDPLAIQAPQRIMLTVPSSSTGGRHRLLPTDVLMQRRIRRVPSLLAADHTAHTENVTLVIS